MTAAAEPGAGAGTAAAEAGSPAGAVLSVVKGEPTPEELAALTAVVLSLGRAPQAAPATPGVRVWVRRQQLRLAPKPGPDAWRRSLG